VAISVDGGPMPGFPNARPDNGIATTLKVSQVPAVFLAQPFTGKITPIGFGVLSESQLLERIAVVSGPQAEAMLPGTTQRLALPPGAMNDHHPPLRRPSAALLALLLVISPLPLRAGDLNTEVNNMFNNLGAIGNYTAPGAFRGQTFNTYTGGNLMMRSPNKVYQLAAIQFPSAKAGCGGIDVFGGSFSHISATEFKNMLKNITAALPGIAFQLALEAVSPLLGGLTKWAKGLETWINNARINSCETAKAIVSTAAESSATARRKPAPIWPSRWAWRATGCGAPALCDRPAQHPGLGAFLQRSECEEQGPFVGNLTWKALAVHRHLPRRSGARADHEPGRHHHLLPGGIGPRPRADRAHAHLDQPVAVRPERGAGTDVIQHMLKCNDYTNCDVVTLNTGYTHTPFTAKVEAMMRSIAEKIATRTAIPTTRPRSASEPDHRAGLQDAVHRHQHPGSGLADSLIAQYRDVIAADYAYVFLERNLRLGMAALDKNYTLQQTQRDQANQVRQRAQAMLLQLSQEKNLLYQKVGSFRAVSSHLEQLERQLRSSMPQHVMDMLGQQAAYLSQ
jgi:conjugative transfer pilus assembly protein TraH